MIGTGVFTSVGFQLTSVQNTWSILLLWLMGGILALFGAFAYAELGSSEPTEVPIPEQIEEPTEGLTEEPLEELAEEPIGQPDFL